ncbi:MAG: sigma-70 family RNA polymerase sigma factor [Myxococcota bacterium]
MECDLNRTGELVQAGDIDVLERILCCHGEKLRAIGRCRCRTEQEAQDAVQDALLAAGERLESYRGDGDVVAWIGRMVANACHRMRRGRKNDPALHATDAPLASQDNPERAAGRRELAEALVDALSTLKPEDQTLLRLAAVDGYTGPELAVEMNLSAQAVRARLSRARRRVRRTLEENGFSGESVTLWGEDASSR